MTTNKTNVPTTGTNPLRRIEDDQVRESARDLTTYTGNIGTIYFNE